MPKNYKNTGVLKMKNISKSLQEIENIESLLHDWLKVNAPKDSGANVISLLLGGGPSLEYKKDFLIKSACPSDITQRILLYVQNYEVSLYIKTKLNLLLSKDGFLSLENALSFVKAQKSSIKKLNELKITVSRTPAGIDAELSAATQTPISKVIDKGLRFISKKL